MEDTQNPTPPSLRESLVRLLQVERPEADFADDEALYGQVIDDYADYARLLTESHERDDRLAAAESQLADAVERLSHYEADISAARAEGELRGRNDAIRQHLRDSAPATDGIPVLPHGLSNADMRTASFFDLARQ